MNVIFRWRAVPIRPRSSAAGCSSRPATKVRRREGGRSQGWNLEGVRGRGLQSYTGMPMCSAGARYANNLLRSMDWPRASGAMSANPWESSCAAHGTRPAVHQDARRAMRRTSGVGWRNGEPGLGSPRECGVRCRIQRGTRQKQKSQEAERMGLNDIYEWQVSGERAKVLIKAVEPDMFARRCEQIRKASSR